MGVTVPNLLATANKWLSPQTHKISSSNNIFKTVEPEDSDTYSRNFNFVAGSFPNSDATKNFVFRQGFNIGNGGGQVDATRSTNHDEWENHFVNGGVDVVERHFCMTTSNGTLRRWMTFLGRSDGTAPANPAQFSAGLNVDNFFIHERTNSTTYLNVDSTTGFNVSNLALGLKVDTTSAGTGLTIGTPSGHTTGNYFTLSRNSSTFASINAQGEVAFTGSGLSGAGPNDALFQIRGRTGSGDSLRVQSAAGANTLQVAGDNSYLINTAATFYNRGDLLVQSGATTRFGIISSSGQVWSNQWSSGGPAGAVNGKFPIYSEAGTLRGYFETKALV